MIHAVVSLWVDEHEYSLGERPGAPEASYDVCSKIGLHSNYPTSEPTKKQPLSQNFAKIAKNSRSRGAQKIRRETKLPKNCQNLLSWRGHKIPAYEKLPKIAEWEGT
jgi:hypothetical protein